MRRPVSVVLALIATLPLARPRPAQAEAAEMRYEVYWGGFHSADVALTSDGERGAYHARLGVTTTGAARLLSDMHFQAEAWGHPAGRGVLTPDRFSADTTSTRADTRLALQFDHGHAPARITLDETHRLTPDDDPPPPRPPVPPELRVGTIDPLSALVELGRLATAAAAGIGPASFVLAVYDGRQRYDANVWVTGLDRINIGGQNLTGIAVQILFRPLAGFRDSSRDMWENATFTALIDRSSGLPLHIVSRNFTVATVINAEVAEGQ